MASSTGTPLGALERSEINLGLDNVDRVAAGLEIEQHVLLLNPDLQAFDQDGDDVAAGDGADDSAHGQSGVGPGHEL